MMEFFFRKNSFKKTYTLKRERFFVFIVISLFFFWKINNAFSSFFELSLPKAPSDLLLKISEENIRNHLAYLASDELEGRGTGSRGEKLSVKYIETQFKLGGLQTTLQEVPMYGIKPIFPDKHQLQLSSRETGEKYQFLIKNDFVISTESLTQELEISLSKVIFIGYGIYAPEYNWNDFKNVDVSGKVLLAFVNEPKINGLFKGDAELTYYGRWMYKLEESRRRKAQALILIHTDETAGYPFSVISNQEEQIRLREVPENALQWRMWISKSTAERLAFLSKYNLDKLFQMANSKSFTPFPLQVELNLKVQFSSRLFSGTNVIGILPGKIHPDEYILVSAHHDHLGIGSNDKGDNIYNGAEDNASGVSSLLTLAQTLGSYEQLDRSVVFLSLTAEEYGLLGAFYYVQNPIVPIEKTSIDINFDIMNMNGITRDIVGLGAELSELKTLFQQAAHHENLYISPDPNPSSGSFFRSDAFAFARAGIPSVYIWLGSNFVGKPSNYFVSARESYIKERYHQPSDEYNPNWSLSGTVQQVRVVLRLIYGISQGHFNPKWYKESANAFLPR